MSTETENKLYAVVIRTKNLDQLRTFYRDVLDLGPPIIDSNYWTEFKLSDGANLILELIDQDSDNCPDKNSKNAIDWALLVDDLDLEKQRLADSKVEFAGEEFERFGKRVLICRDPDGNLIHLISKK